MLMPQMFQSLLDGKPNEASDSCWQMGLVDRRREAGFAYLQAPVRRYSW